MPSCIPAVAAMVGIPRASLCFSCVSLNPRIILSMSDRLSAGAPSPPARESVEVSVTKALGVAVDGARDGSGSPRNSAFLGGRLGRLPLAGVGLPLAGAGLPLAGVGGSPPGGLVGVPCSEGALEAGREKK